MRIIGFLCLAALILYGLCLGALALAQRRLIYVGAYEALPRPQGTPAGTQAVRLTSADGESLHALWKPPLPGCGVVLSFHGNGSFPEPHAARFAESPWREGGWGVLAIAYRGYPGSTGSPNEAGLTADGFAAYRFVATQAPGAPVLLHGHSLGSAVAVAVAQREAHLGLYLEAPFDSMSRLVRLHFPLVPSRLFLLDTYRSDERIAGSAAPVLIVQGDADEIVPAKLALSLAAAAGERARIAVIPGDHMSVFGSRDDEAAALFGRLVPAACRGEPHTVAR